MSVFKLDCLGTSLKIMIDSSSSADEDFRCIAERIGRFEQKYSRFVPGNWLDTLNETGNAEIDGEWYRMLSFALELAKLTNGAFDPTIGSLLSRLGYGRKDELGNACPIGYQHVELSADQVKLHNGVRLEFGWVGKGYMLHEIAGMLSHYERYVVDFWGDLYVRGWFAVGLEDPRDVSKAIGTVAIQDGFFCASSGAKRKIKDGVHHLVDPRKGLSSEQVLGSFVESNDWMVADGFATALCVLPLEESFALLASGKIEWAIMAYDGAVFKSPGTKVELFA